jgi:hypothetical protein
MLAMVFVAVQLLELGTDILLEPEEAVVLLVIGPPAEPTPQPDVLLAAVGDGCVADPVSDVSELELLIAEGSKRKAEDANRLNSSEED